MPAKETVYIKINDTEVVRLKVLAGAYNQALMDAIGMLKPTATGKPPSGYAQIGSGKGDAVENGAITVLVVYENPTSKLQQTARVLFSPTSTVNGIFSQFVGKKYSNKDIIMVRMPRRRSYSY